MFFEKAMRSASRIQGMGGQKRNRKKFKQRKVSLRRGRKVDTWRVAQKQNRARTPRYDPLDDLLDGRDFDWVDFIIKKAGALAFTTFLDATV